MFAGIVTAAESALSQAPWVYKLVFTGGNGQLVAPVLPAQVAFFLYCLQSRIGWFRKHKYYLELCNDISSGAT